MNNNAIEYYKSVSSVMEKFCEPLNDYFGISLLTYFKVYYKDSSYIALSNDIKFIQKYCSTVNSDAVYFQKYIQNNTESRLFLWPKDPKNIGMHTYFINGYWHGMGILQYNNDSVEVISFIANKNNSQINNLFVKYYNILEKFTSHFKLSLNDVISKAELYKAQFKDGCNLYVPEKEKLTDSNNIKSFLEAIGINKGVFDSSGKYMQLTSKERQCLELMHVGHSVKGISKELLLSPKTVEVHLNNIKNKTGNHSKNELIQMYRNSFMR
jgi:DNA-binding CsgD family transcriptional regulator